MIDSTAFNKAMLKLFMVYKRIYLYKQKPKYKSAKEDMMKVKTITGWTEESLDNKVNEFLADPAIEVVELKFSSTIFSYSVMILYKNKTS